MDSEDKQWATKYLLDPLTAPEPSDETGPGSHFVREDINPKTPQSTTPSKGPTLTVYPTPPTSASPTQSAFHPTNPFSSPQDQAAIGSHSNNQRRISPEDKGKGKSRRRGSSLGERYPGDMSHRPLDQLRAEAKAAHRSPHLKKKHLPGADTIDSLDRTMFGAAYHHEGPYDATLLARNTSYKTSPVEAVRGSNEEAIRATPRENIQDSLVKHVPLQGTAIIPPGYAGLDGREMQYEEGADLMREADAPGGAYKRYEGIKYLPEDYKGKGEPSFSLERALKDNPSSSHQRATSNPTNAYEMQSGTNKHLRPGSNRLRSISGDNVKTNESKKASGNSMRYSDFEGDLRRSNSTGVKISDGLKRRFGSLRRGMKASSES